MRSTKVFLFALLFMGLSTITFSKDIYLRFENSCMDRMEYARTDNSRHIIYQLKKNDRERIILEVGNEAGNYNSYLPSTAITCQSLQISESFARGINNGSTKLYIVRPYSGGYTVSPVKTANFFYNTDSEIGYSSSEGYVFVYNLSVKTKGINLATKDSKAKVYFRGTEAATCPTRYYFRKVSKENYQPYTDMVFVPKVGIIKTKRGMDAVDANKNKMTLVKVNGVRTNKYLEAVCNGYENYIGDDNMANNNRPTDNTNSSTTPTRNRLEELESSGNSTYYPPSSTNNTNTTTGTTYYPTGQSICTIYKDVDRGLYMDRATGLPASGSCGGNDYRNGYMINKTNTTVVTTPPTTRPVYTQPTQPTQPTYTPPTTSPYRPTNGPIRTTPPPSQARNNCGIVATEGTHVVLKDETLYSIARRYNVSVKELKRLNNIRNINLIKPCSRLKIRATSIASRGSEIETSNSGEHIVKRNETLYGISKAYGYTVKKFAEMNGINPGEVIYIGQRLKTKDCNCPATSATASIPKSYNYATAPAVERLVEKGGEGTSEAIPTEYSAPKRIVHIVKENDTIFSIARKYKTSVDNIRRLNNLEKTEIIIPFQRIYIN